jgi:serine/threonine protein phosphatase 1
MFSLFERVSDLLRGDPKSPLIYAIGDVHGRLDLLRDLSSQIQTDRGTRDAEVILLGDYVDRGPKSAGVLDALIAAEGFDGVTLTCLKGNHEAAFLEFLADPETGPRWAQIGGLDTIGSYGLRAPARKTDMALWAKLRDDLLAAIPDAHLDFLNNLAIHQTRGDYMFVHAGIDPRRPLEVQSEAEFLWIRKAFHKHAHRLKFTVVHGHSAKTKPIRKRGRICVDTGAYSTGRLTAVRIDRNRTRFLSTS